MAFSSGNGDTRECDNSNSFPQFDVATDVSDHNFVDSPQSVDSGSPLYKTIMKEWKILQNNLPETIYVRVYEARMELMRAVIIGPPGTPYHDGLFFFDILFPADYPNSPPRFYYKSFGYRLNPNLYVDGKVCLSILNTWEGRHPSEKWIPGKSTILQVLVSLQGLVLNEKPYYNEPELLLAGWSWRSYNERTFVRSCYTMLLLMRTPPKNFENFIRAHFRDRSRDILTSCQVYMNGFLMVGHYQNGQSFLEEQVKVAWGSQLEWCYKNLGVAFQKYDPSLGGFLDDLNQMVETKKSEYERKKDEKRSKSVVRRVLRLIMRVGGCLWCVPH